MDPIPDDQLRLIFTCCHPALAPEAAVALTLRTLGGLTTPEIAHAFLVPEPTLAQRLVRAKKKIREAGHRLRGADRRPAGGPARRRAAGALPRVQRGLRRDRRRGADPARAVRRGDPAGARPRRRCCPTSPRRAGLLALMLLTDARRPARESAPTATLVRLEEQDRARWYAAADRGGPGARGARAAARPRRAVPAPGGDRRASTTRRPTRGRHRLAADPRAVRGARCG